jgi:hypothetical protein
MDKGRREDERFSPLRELDRWLPLGEKQSWPNDTPLAMS